jgi:putative transposase
MARLGRYFLPEQPLHVIQRGNNRQAIFFDDDDYVRYRNWLAEAAAEYGCVVHAYVLMTNHAHLLATPREAGSLPRVMQSLGRRYVRHVNTLYRRTGTLWEALSRCADRQRKIFPHLLPVHRAQSGSRAHGAASARVPLVELSLARARGAADALAVGHDLYYDRLGRTPAERQIGYRALFRDALDAGFIDALRAATNGGWALGDARFKSEIANALGRRVAPLPRGWPPKPKTKAQQPSLL